MLTKDLRRVLLDEILECKEEIADVEPVSRLPVRIECMFQIKDELERDL